MSVKSVSRSRLPKADRVPRDLDAEMYPDPSDYFRSAVYIDRRAELGDVNVKGAPACTLIVLHYLWRHTVRNQTGKGLGGDEAPGWVLTGKSKIAKIATECNVAYNSAQKALLWLCEAEWLGGNHAEGHNIRFYVRMDMAGHGDREAVRNRTVTPDGTVPPHDVGHPLPQDGTVPPPQDGRQYRDSKGTWKGLLLRRRNGGKSRSTPNPKANPGRR